MYPFVVDQAYKRKDIYKIIGVREDTKGGNWDTGYCLYKNDFFIFCNVGVPGRTGHDYGNRFVGDDLYWFAKQNTTLKQPEVQRLLNPPGFAYIFYRYDSRLPFTYAGTGIPISHQDTSPVQITWQICEDHSELPSNKEEAHLYAGKLKSIQVNIYERNPVARAICIKKNGFSCKVCGFNFEETYGDLGKNYIQVHYVKPLAESPGEHELSPETDLVPICANCHSMIHKKKPALTVEQLAMIVASHNGQFHA